MSNLPDAENSRRLTRRHLLWGGAAAAGVGAAAAAGLGLLTTTTSPLPADGISGASDPGALLSEGRADFAVAEPFYGTHQAGIATAAQAHGIFIALDLRDGVDAAALRRLMVVLTDDAARLTAGAPALADSEPELATIPARLTVTFGFGSRVVELAGAAGPQWLRPLPAFTVDRLDPRYCGGDILIQLAADDPMTIAHTARMLLKDARSFAVPRWSQSGFRRAAGAQNASTTMRNLFGQFDGSANPNPGTAEFDAAVWSTDVPTWLQGGTGFVLRRIAMDLDGWDKIDRSGREETIGRTLTTGAPLTGHHESDLPDLEAKDRLGFSVIPAFAHLRRAKEAAGGLRMFRRGYNYDDAMMTDISSDGANATATDATSTNATSTNAANTNAAGTDAAGASISNSGLLFASFQADIDKQFVPVQRALDQLDLLNTWTTPIGSAVFAIAPGCQPGGYIGDTLF